MDLKENLTWDELVAIAKSNITIVKAEDWVGPSDDDPFLKKKLEEAIEALQKNPIPEHLLRRAQEPE